MQPQQQQQQGCDESIHSFSSGCELTSWDLCIHQPCSLLVIVPGFGGLHIDEKVSILLTNIKLVEANAKDAFSSIHWHIYSCDDDYQKISQALTAAIPAAAEASPQEPTNAAATTNAGSTATLLSTATISRTKLFKSTALLGDVLRDADVTGYDYVMLFADGIELQEPVNWPLLLAIQQTHQLDLVTGCALPEADSDADAEYSHMQCQLYSRANAYTVVEQRMVELLHAMLFTQQAYVRFSEFLDPENSKTLWGMDWIIDLAMGLRCGRVGFMPYVQRFSIEEDGSSSFSADEADRNMRSYLRRLDVDIRSLSDEQSPILKFVVERVTHYARDDDERQ